MRNPLKVISAGFLLSGVCAQEVEGCGVFKCPVSVDGEPDVERKRDIRLSGIARTYQLWQ
jgi:hypothetical protein